MIHEMFLAERKKKSKSPKLTINILSYSMMYRNWQSKNKIKTSLKYKDSRKKRRICREINDQSYQRVKEYKEDQDGVCICPDKEKKIQTEKKDLQLK